MTRCVFVEGAATCRTLTARSFFVNGVPGEWPCCGQHGHRMLKALMAAFPGHGIYTRKGER